MPGETIRLIDPQGTIRDVPVEAAGSALDSGWSIPTAAQDVSRVAEHAREANYGGVVGGVKAGAAALARGATLGLSDVAARAIGGEDTAIELEGLREAHPYVSGAGELAGAVAPAFFTGGAALPAGAAGGVGRGVAAAAGGGLRGAVAGGVVEGGLFGLGSGVSELALSQDPLTLEHAASALGSNALFGAAAGGALGGTFNVVERGLLKGKSVIDEALERRALSKAKTPAEAIETGDLSLLDKRLLDAAEHGELERIKAEQAPEREAFTKELDEWRKANRDSHDLREVTQASHDANLREASGAFDRSNLRLRAALDDRVGFAEDPLKSLKAVRSQGQALEEMRAAAIAHEQQWRLDVAEAPARIRSALEEVSALGSRARSSIDIPEYSALKSQLDNAGEDYLEQIVPARSIAEHGYYEPPGAGVDKIRVAKAAKAIESGQQEAIKLNVTPSGKIVVDDGRHRLAAAIKSERPIRIKWSTGFEPSAEMVPGVRAPSGGADLLKARKKLAAQHGLGDEIGPFTPAGIDAAAGRVLKERQSLVWGGTFKGGLKAPSIVSRIPKINDLIAANQRLQSQLEALAKPPTSELLTKIADARAVLEAPKQPSVGGAIMSMVAPFAGPVGAAASLGSKLVGGVRKIVETAAVKTGQVVSVVAGTTAAASKYAAPVATRTLLTHRFSAQRDEDDDKKPLPELYKQRTEEVKRLTEYDETGTPRMRFDVRQRVAQLLKPIAAVDPIAADRMETLVARRIAHVSAAIPRRPDFGTPQLGPDNWQPSDMQMRSWARTVAASEDPHGVEERAAHGALTPEDVKAYWAIYPERAQSFKMQILGAVGTKQAKAMSFDRALGLSMLLGQPLHPALHPRVLAVLQGQFTAEPGTSGGSQPPRAALQFGSIKKEARTPAQERAVR